MTNANAEEFFESFEKLIKENGITIDRPKGFPHSRFPDLLYPIDYGYINGTRSQDGEEIDLFLGDDESLGVVGVICAVDSFKKDSEIKILYNCTKENIQTAMKMMNNGCMRGVLIRREQETRHLGVYGVILNSRRDKILLIKKAKGPYLGLFDLPGGTPEFHESFEETLRREILEETGLIVKACRQISTLLNIERYNEIILRHVGIIYLVEAEGEIKKDSDGADSDGSTWIDIESVKSGGCAPLVAKIVSRLKGKLK